VLALKLLLERLGDRAIYKCEVLNDDPSFASILSTTWEDLVDVGMVQARPGLNWCHYQLTAKGWLEALQLTGEFDSTEFQSRFGRLNATLNSLRTRSTEGFEQVHVVAMQADVPEDWLFNILESQIWERRHNRYGAHFDESETMVIIPARFNMPLL
jgi:hypothetical protein